MRGQFCFKGLAFLAEDILAGIQRAEGGIADLVILRNILKVEFFA